MFGPKFDFKDFRMNCWAKAEPYLPPPAPFVGRRFGQADNPGPEDLQVFAPQCDDVDYDEYLLDSAGSDVNDDDSEYDPGEYNGLRVRLINARGGSRLY